MARSRSKKATPKSETPKPGPTAGFYKKNSAGNALNFAPTAVHFPGGSSLEIDKVTEYEYPVNGWSYYESAEVAYAAEGLPMPEAKDNQTRQSLAEKIAARRAMTREEKEAERAQREAEREAERIARLEKTHPERAEQLKARSAQRQERMAQREALRTMSPEERNPLLGARAAKAY